MLVIVISSVTTMPHEKSQQWRLVENCTSVAICECG